MREIDKTFLTLFKNIRIVENEQGGYVAYSTYSGNAISNREIVGLVKKYQELLIEELIKEK